jgi:hypothetical protein
MSIKKILLFILVLIMAGILINYVYLYFPGELKELVLQGTIGGLPTVDENVSYSVSQFYPNMRFNHNNLTYNIDNACSEDKTLKMEKAFDTLSSRTGIITFEESPLKGTDIIVICSMDKKQKNQNTFITGEGGPSKFLNLEFYPLIIEGEIILYEDLYTVKCSEPVIEIHELLHVFGYDHINNKSSVLYPYFSCEQTLGDKVVDDMVRLYSLDPLAELYFGNVSAEKSGIYLNFDVEISNHGLIDAEEVDLIVYGDNRLVKEFPLDPIGVGATTTFSIENLKLRSRGTKEITLEISSETEEYGLVTNVVKLKTN